MKYNVSVEKKSFYTGDVLLSRGLLMEAGSEDIRLKGSKDNQGREEVVLVGTKRENLSFVKKRPEECDRAVELLVK